MCATRCTSRPPMTVLTVPVDTSPPSIQPVRASRSVALLSLGSAWILSWEGVAIACNSTHVNAAGDTIGNPDDHHEPNPIAGPRVANRRAFPGARGTERKGLPVRYARNEQACGVLRRLPGGASDADDPAPADRAVPQQPALALRRRRKARRGFVRAAAR